MGAKKGQDASVNMRKKGDRFHAMVRYLQIDSDNGPNHTNPVQINKLSMLATEQINEEAVEAENRTGTVQGGQTPVSESTALAAIYANNESNYKKISTVKVVAEKVFNDMFADLKKSKQTLGNIINYIQTTVKDEKGVGQAIDIRFRAPLNDLDEDTQKEEINYDFNSLGEDLDLLKQKRFKRYAEKQCLKMAYYLQKVRNIEVLAMDAEFLKDDSDNVWFSYASKIQYRNILKIESAAAQALKRAIAANQKH